MKTNWIDNSFLLGDSVVGISYFEPPFLRMREHQHRLNVLVADDDLTFQFLVKKAFEKQKRFTVETASNGKEALQKIDWFNPTIILVDLKMPTMDGIKLIQALKNIHRIKNIPVVGITGSDFEEAEKKVFDLGGRDFFKSHFLLIIW